MGSMTNVLAQDLLDHVLNKVTFTNPAAIYLCLCTADPTDAATGASMSEVPNLYAYQRTAIVLGAAGGGRVIDQVGSVDFPTASGGAWGDATHWCITDNQTYGTGLAMAFGALNATKSIADGDTPSVAASEVDVTVSTGEASNYLASTLLDFAFRDQAFVSPTVYVGFTDAVMADGTTGATASEPAGGSYARLLIYDNGSGTPDFNLATLANPSVVDNSDEVALAAATASWSTLTSWFLSDSITTGAGNILFYDNDVTDKPVGDGDTAKFNASALICQMS